MVFKSYMLAVKNPNVSMEYFKDQWDNHHIKLLKEIAGDAYPIAHMHYYPDQFQGPADAQYDGIGVLEFESRAAFEKLVEVAMRPESQARLDPHERSFLDKDRCQMYTVDTEEEGRSMNGQ